MFRKLLVANRGEIACRIIRTARRLGIETVAVYSDADAQALHAQMADEAWRLGPAPAAESYLDGEKIIDIARRAGVDCIHPGYGFLSENADFAENCGAADLVFIGPSPTAMRAMGSKAAAKDIMAKAGVPVAPGVRVTNAIVAIDVAASIGFPVLVKASAGGGGRGMRIVRDASALRDALDSAAREARAAFGDGTLIIEKYVTSARHVEVQICGDRYGEIVAFFERDCSMQRRHQKIIEETPAPHLSQQMRRVLRQAAVQAGAAVGYVGAGTVEFLVQGEAFYFLEMNTRLQVEHPITEMISGQDLVEWQLRVACGEPLPLRQDQLAMQGSAIEARICAEEPSRNFMPATGVIEHLRLPREEAALRIDTGVRQGDRVTHYYDSLLAKLVVYGEDRAAAIPKLQRALDAFELVGVANNLDLLRRLAQHPAFLGGGYDTTFLESALPTLDISPQLTDESRLTVLAAGAAAWLADAGAQEDPDSPWQADGWRLGGPARQSLAFRLENEAVDLHIQPRAPGKFRLDLPFANADVEASETGGVMFLRINDVQRKLSVLRLSGGFVVILDGRAFAVSHVSQHVQTASESAAERQVTAPLPARITAVHASPGEEVKRGATLVVLEAMKMEIALAAPRDGIVESVRCAVGDMAPEGALLVSLAEEKAA